MYLIAVLCPPLAVLMCGKPFQAMLNCLLCLLLYLPGLIHAVAVVAEHKSNERNAAIVGAIRGGRRRSSYSEPPPDSGNPFDFG